MDKCIATRAVSKRMFFSQARAKKGFHQHFHYVYFTTIFFFCLKASFFPTDEERGSVWSVPWPGSFLSPPHPLVPWSPSAVADHFFVIYSSEDERLPPIHPRIHPAGQRMRPQQPTSISVKGTASLNVRSLEKSCAEKQEPPHLIAQKLCLSLSLV